MIKLSDICFAYDDVPVLSHFSMEVKKGETLVLQGPNGCGKTTLFQIINGLVFEQSGTYEFDGTEIDKKYLSDAARSKKFHQRIGYLFQNPDNQLFLNSVEEEIAFGPLQMGKDESEILKRTDDMLRLLNIENLRKRAPYHLSTGEKKKVALAGMLSVNPDVMILDEPLSGLDRTSQIWMTDFLQQMRKAGKTILLATHNESFASEIGDRIVTMM